jgi:type 2 lantibiotic biosynthesis protein LanM
LLLHERTHPDVLRDALDRDRLFDWLWVEVERQPSLARTIAAERQDLEGGDVPCFTSRPGSRSIWTSAGVEITDYFDRTGLERVEARLRAMDDVDLERQRWFLRASLTSLERAGRPEVVVGRKGIGAPRSERNGDEALARPEEFLDAAARVAHRLETLAFVDGTHASWVGLTLVAEERWSLVPLGLDLYGGLPGIALFLARLARTTGDRQHRQLALQTTAGVTALVEAQRAWPLIGAFAGWGGVIYTLAHLGLLLEDERYLEQAAGMVARIAGRVDEDQMLDVVSGAAGSILSLAALQAVRPADETLETIRLCARRLVTQAEMQLTGWGWRTGLASTAPLLGFSHGASGMALALLTASALLNDGSMRGAAKLALEYERSEFVATVRNWPDYRVTERRPVTTRATRGSSSEVERGADEDGSPAQTFMTTWCHGAPGVGLARAAGLRYLDDWKVRSEIATAVQTTIKLGFGKLGFGKQGFGKQGSEASHCLCHGDLGNLELLTVAAAKFGDTALKKHAAQVGTRILRSIEESGWRCGVPLHVETPGLMMGLAGIGDGLLRLAKPGLPCLLMLDPPGPLHGRARKHLDGRPREGGEQIQPDPREHEAVRTTMVEG